MTTKIDKLTPEQEALKSVVRDEWIRHFDSCPKIEDEAKTASDIQWVYGLANLKTPEVVFVDSPWAAQVEANKRAGNKKMEFFAWGYYMDASDAGWVAFYDYFERIGVDLKCEHWPRWKDLIRAGIFSTIQLDGLCIASRMPKYIRRESFGGRMHSLTGPSIRFADGWEMYCLWGVRFPKDLFEGVTQKKISAGEVLKITNMEQRMAALKVIGAENILDAVKSKLIDEQQGYRLYLVKGLTDQDEYALRYNCPSTGREYVSFVNPEVGKKKDALEAIASKWKLTKKQWSLIAAHS